jgi:hypothetical protein
MVIEKGYALFSGLFSAWGEAAIFSSFSNSKCFCGVKKFLFVRINEKVIGDTFSIFS